MTKASEVHDFGEPPGMAEMLGLNPTCRVCGLMFKSEDFELDEYPKGSWVRGCIIPPVERKLHDPECQCQTCVHWRKRGL